MLHSWTNVLFHMYAQFYRIFINLDVLMIQIYQFKSGAPT